MAAIVLNDGASLTPDEFEKFLATQPDLSPKAWPRFVRINNELPQTATSKILKRELIRGGGDGRGRRAVGTGGPGHRIRRGRANESTFAAVRACATQRGSR